MNKLQQAAKAGRSAIGFVRRKSAALLTLAVAGLALGFAPVAQAQAPTNTGVQEIVNAIDGLKPDMSFVVVAAIGLALIGMGAVVAISLAKRLMGK